MTSFTEKYIIPKTIANDRRNAASAMRLSLTNSFPRGVLIVVAFLVDSPLTLVSVSAKDSDATVDARVEDLSLDDMVLIKR